jgi:transcriptional regulator with XRE-family HTH domain
VELAKQQMLKSFGANVRRLRSAAGLTQAKLAERVNVELRTLQKFESGEINPPLFTIFRVRRALNCQWDELLGRPK